MYLFLLNEDQFDGNFGSLVAHEDEFEPYIHEVELKAVRTNNLHLALFVSFVNFCKVDIDMSLAKVFQNDSQKILESFMIIYRISSPVMDSLTWFLGTSLYTHT